MSNIYFGGSRHPQNINPSQIAAVVAAVVAAGNNIHVGCQFGVDQAVIQEHIYTAPANLLHIFAVAGSWSQAQDHIRHAYTQGANVTLSAGGTTAPIQARYLLRSIAAFQNCNTAVFFNPGSGSLAVMREYAKTNNPIFVFSETQPARIPSTVGAWCSPVFFAGFQCFGWGYPSSKQFKLF